MSDKNGRSFSFKFRAKKNLFFFFFFNLAISNSVLRLKSDAAYESVGIVLRKKLERKPNGEILHFIFAVSFNLAFSGIRRVVKMFNIFPRTAAKSRR